MADNKTDVKKDISLLGSALDQMFFLLDGIRSTNIPTDEAPVFIDRIVATLKMAAAAYGGSVEKQAMTMPEFQLHAAAETGRAKAEASSDPRIAKARIAVLKQAIEEAKAGFVEGDETIDISVFKGAEDSAESEESFDDSPEGDEEQVAAADTDPDPAPVGDPDPSDVSLAALEGSLSGIKEAVAKADEPSMDGDWPRDMNTTNFMSGKPVDPSVDPWDTAVDEIEQHVR